MRDTTPVGIRDAATVLYMSMSLDGFITALDDDHDKPLGGDGRLHDWLSEGGGPAGSRPSGASRDVFDELVAAGVLDELEIHQIPVLLGQGRRLFDHLGPDHIELRLSRIVDAPGVTHLRYRVRR